MIGIDIDDFEESLPSGYSFGGEEVWFYDKELEEHSAVISILSGEDWVFIEDGKFELMQFTGLFDRNGKEIYEGDIVKFIDDVTNPDKPTEIHTEVFWWDVMARYSVKNTAMELNFCTNDLMEVIGNIHQNPDLL